MRRRTETAVRAAPSEEAVNGIAFSGDLMAVSTLVMSPS